MSLKTCNGIDVEGFALMELPIWQELGVVLLLELKLEPGHCLPTVMDIHIDY